LAIGKIKKTTEVKRLEKSEIFRKNKTIQICVSYSNMTSIKNISEIRL